MCEVHGGQLINLLLVLVLNQVLLVGVLLGAHVQLIVQGLLFNFELLVFIHQLLFFRFEKGGLVFQELVPLLQADKLLLQVLGNVHVIKAKDAVRLLDALHVHLFFQLLPLVGVVVGELR